MNFYNVIVVCFLVMIYSKNCTDDIDAVGPNWYRLEVIGSEENLGRFEKPWEYSGAVRRNEVRNFTSLCMA